MSENNFENKVQQKMEGLEFVPSDAVWKNIDKEINKEKKRRMPLFWIFFFSGLFILGGIYFWKEKESSRAHTLVSVSTEKQAGSGQAPVGPSAIAPTKSNEPRVSRKENDGSNNEKAIGANGKSIANENPIKNENPEQDQQENKETAYQKKANKLIHKTVKNAIAFNAGNNNKKDRMADSNDSDEPSELEKTKLPKGQDENESSSIKTITKMEAVVGKKAIDSISQKSNIDLVKTKTQIKDSSAGNKQLAAINKQKQKQKPKWQWGISGAAGVSGVERALFKSGNNTNYYNNAAFTASGSPLNSNSTTTSTDINNDLSFSAGFFVRKPISKRFSFSIGLNYHYYSNRVSIGQHVDSTLYIYSSSTSTNPNANNILPLPLTYNVQVSNYYFSGTRIYINQYHFLEIPLSINIQLNKTNKLPLVWENGFSILYLIHSNALISEPGSGIFYSNNSLLNQTQLHALTAIMLGMPLNKGELMLGPQLQYGLTGLLNQDLSNPEHLLFAGLKLRYIPKIK